MKRKPHIELLDIIKKINYQFSEITVNRTKNKITENSLVIDLLDTEPHTSRENTNENVQVEEKRRPGSRLMLTDTSDDRNVNLGIAGVPERVEAATPRGDIARIGERNDGGENEAGDEEHGEDEELAELGLGELGAQVREERVGL